MTAADDAIEAMVAANTATTTWAQLLEAIPNHVLIRYAIERGALERVGTYIRGSQMPGLYRVVDEL